MYLKKVAIENFKSFKGKLVVPLYPGYTGITGPNGSGKSNICDAVLFVLGPKSSRVLRAGKQSDLIYDPGHGRSHASCSVSLYFDNTGREFPMASDEVVLTRTVKRSPSDPEGYASYFYLNGRRSSLAEFESLLAHARISADSYNIVQQGDITRIVQMTSIERRRILESIAGITRYDEEIERAAKKMEDVKNDIERIQLLMVEIQSRIAQLEEERAHALEYQKVKAEYDTARAQLAYRDVVMGEEERKSTEREIQRCEGEIANLKTQLEGKSSEARTLDEQIAKMEAEMNAALGDEYKKLRTELDKKRLERAKIENTLETAESAVAQKTSELDDIKSKIKSLQKSISARREKVDGLQADLNAKKVKEEALRLELDEITSKAEGSSGKMKKAADERRALEAEIEKMTEEVQAETLECEKISLKLQDCEKRRTDVEERIGDIRFQIKDLEFNMKDALDKEGQRKKERDALVNEFHGLRAKCDALSKEIDNLTTESKKVARDYDAAMREASKGDDKGYTPAVSAILEARSKGQIKGIHGTVSDLIAPEERFEDAVLVAGTQRLSAIVVDDDARASECIDYLKKNNKGRCRFLPLNKMIGGKPRGKALAISQREGVLGFVTDHITYDPKYENAMWDVFGDTLVCESLANARTLMGGVRLVTVGGELIEPSGAMIGGSLNRQQGSSKNRLEILGKQLKQINDLIDAKEAELKGVHERFREVENRIQELNISEEHADAGRVKSERDGYTASVKKAEAELASILKEMEVARKAHDSLGSKLKNDEEALASKKEIHAKLKKEIDESMSEEMTGRVNSLRDEQMKAVNARSEASTALATEQTALAGEEKEMASLSEQSKKAEKEIDQIDEKKAKGIDAKSDLDKEISEAEAEVNEWTAKCDKVNKEKEALVKKKTENEIAIGGVQSNINVKSDRINDLKVKIGALDEKVKLARESYSGLGIEVKEPLPTLKEIRGAISEGEQRLNACGNINLKAIEEYDVQSKRNSELLAEVKRLEEERGELSSLRNEIDTKKKTELLVVFGEMDKNFRAIFPILSEGDEGWLELENPDSPFEGGLVIHVSNKTGVQRSMTSLSGGQKSLAALAFTFALQRYTPSQFYILDEVDMFLDAINAETIARTIKQSSKQAQFIQISLRKVTLNWVDHIIGVYHRNDGCSEVVMKANLADELPDEKAPEAEAVIEADGGGGAR